MFGSAFGDVDKVQTWLGCNIRAQKACTRKGPTPKSQDTVFIHAMISDG
jgi:hypothetical protein